MKLVVASSLEKNPIDTLVISLVQYTNGLLVDFDFLSDLKQKYPRLNIIGDATQYIGTDVFNFNDSPFDAIVCSGYKWLLAGFGNGFVALSDIFLAKKIPVLNNLLERCMQVILIFLELHRWFIHWSV